MSKRTKEEIDALVAEAREALKNAPKMDEASARHLSDKWKRDSRSFNERMVKEK